MKPPVIVLLAVPCLLSSCADPATHITLRGTVPAPVVAGCLAEGVAVVRTVRTVRTHGWQADTTVDYQLIPLDSTYGPYLGGHARLEPGSSGPTLVSSVGWLGTQRPLVHERYAEAQAAAVFMSIAAHCWPNAAVRVACTYESNTKTHTCPSAR